MATSMKCQLEAWLWRGILNTASQIGEEMILWFRKDGLFMRQMDAVHVTMISFLVPTYLWKAYQPLDEPIKLNVKDMGARLRGAIKPEDMVTLECDLKGSSEFTMGLRGQYGYRRFGEPILGLETDEDILLKKPRKLTFNVKAKIVVSALIEALEDSAKLEDFCFIEGRSEPSRFALWSIREGAFKSSWYEFKADKSLFEFNVSGEDNVIRSSYDATVLVKVCKAGHVFSNVCTVMFNKDFPVKLEFELPFDGELEFYLSPRVEVT